MMVRFMNKNLLPITHKIERKKEKNTIILDFG
jgi:hypothetical protein